MSYQDLKTKIQRIADIGYSSAVLSWDQETYMPPKGADFRAQQLSTLAGISHEMFSDESTGKLLSQLEKDASLSENEKKNVDLIREDYSRQKKYSTAFVEKMSRLVSECFQAWQQAKEKDDFSLYANQLEKLIALKREEAELLGYKEHPYDAMLNLYEKGLTSKEVEVLFADVRKQFVLLQQFFLQKEPIV